MAITGNDNTESNAGTGVQERLLDAAEELFCERGFQGATVRDLAAKAGCNIASVNYYFGGKDKLYLEVWRRHLLRLRETRLASIDKVMAESDGRPRLEDLLRSFAYAFIGPLMDENRGPRLIKLMVREMLDQCLPPDMFVKEIIVPTLSAMRGALARICPQLNGSQVQLVVYSVVAQLVQLIRVKTMFEQTENPEFPKLDLSQAVDHVVRFSAAGIRAYAMGESNEDTSR
ncbi:MAG: CerR family C-terminal domain-containing protein [Planctomycetota bacterium]|jgi:AcrR family transcriptional regulator